MSSSLVWSMWCRHKTLVVGWLFILLPSVQCSIHEDAGSLVSYCRTQPTMVIGEDCNKSIFEFVPRSRSAPAHSAAAVLPG